MLIYIWQNLSSATRRRSSTMLSPAASQGAMKAVLRRETCSGALRTLPLRRRLSLSVMVLSLPQERLRLVVRIALRSLCILPVATL